MKKIFLVIAFVAMGLTVVPQVHAQDYSKMEQELNQVAADMQAGKITPQQAQQRIIQIQQKYMGSSDATVGGGQPVPSPQTVTPQQQRQQSAGMLRKGSVAELDSRFKEGWPTAANFRPFGFTLNQPRINSADGLTAYYRADAEVIEIYVHRNWVYNGTTTLLAPPFTAQELQSIRQEVQRASGVTLRDGEGYKELSRTSTGVNSIKVEVDQYMKGNEWIRIYMRLSFNPFEH